MKDNAIFSTTETLNYIADAIHENLHTSEDPIDYGYWTLAFHDVFGDLKLREITEEEDHIVNFYNFLRISRGKNHRWIFKNICNYIYYFKQNGLIKNADEFIISMIIWVLDPIRSYYAKENREKAIDEINYVLAKKVGIIQRNNKTKEYYFIKNQNDTNKNGGVIESIEIVSGDGRIKLYINKNYYNELDFGRKKIWGKLYDLAERQELKFNKGFFDYFNSNKKNPLYARNNFMVTKILKVKEGNIVPNVKLSLITRKKITQSLNRA